MILSPPLVTGNEIKLAPVTVHIFMKIVLFKYSLFLNTCIEMFLYQIFPFDQH